MTTKYMRVNSLLNKKSDKRKPGAVEGVLGTNDQIIIDQCIMEAIQEQYHKQYHRNLVVASYDLKKDYEKVHQFWMLGV